MFIEAKEGFEPSPAGGGGETEEVKEALKSNSTLKSPMLESLVVLS